MSDWIEYKYRTPDDEEIDHKIYHWYDRNNYCILNCEMPKDDQEVLLTIQHTDVHGNTSRIVAQDVCHVDGDTYELEEHSWDDVVAWMPLPESFVGSDNAVMITSDVLNQKMPAESQEVLLTLTRIGIDGKKYLYVAQDLGHIDGDGYWLEEHDWNDVVAWMPLPEPFMDDENPVSTSKQIVI